MIQNPKFTRDFEEENTRKEAIRLGLNYLDLRAFPLEPSVLTLLSKENAQNYKTIPLYQKKGQLFLGILNPFSPFLPKVYEKLPKDYQIILTLISQSSFNGALKRYELLPPPKEEELPLGIVKALSLEFETLDDLGQKIPTLSLKEFLGSLLFAGLKLEASDIHLEPKETQALVRFRLDGILHEGAKISKKQYEHLLLDIKLQTHLKTVVNYPQGGRLEILPPNQKERFDVRVETNPSMYGEDVVLRILGFLTKRLDLKELGFGDKDFSLIENFLLRPFGMLIVVGPTGSGKTTTIYALLNKLNSPEKKIITLEDPIEYSLEGITQIQIEKGEIFGDRLRAVLREDPDIVMLGEIRDLDTAKTSLSAALTGHIMISTLHANNAPTSLVRLLDLAPEPNIIISALNMVIAQRLVRRICQNCKREYQPDEFIKKEIQKIIKEIPKNLLPKKITFYKGKGCSKCNGLGYKGRVGIFEVLKITPAFQDLIIKKPSLMDFKKLALKEGMITMEQDGMLKAMAGITTPEEVLKTIKE